MKRAFGEYSLGLVVVIIAAAILLFVFGNNRNGLFGSENTGGVAPVQTTKGDTNIEHMNDLYDREDPTLVVELPKMYLEESYNLLDEAYVKEAHDADGEPLEVTVKSVIDPDGKDITPVETDGEVILSLSNDNKKREDYFKSGYYTITYYVVDEEWNFSKEETVTGIVDASRSDIYDVLFLDQNETALTEYPIRLRGDLEDTSQFPTAPEGYTFYNVEEDENGDYIKKYNSPWYPKGTRYIETVMLFSNEE